MLTRPRAVGSTYLYGFVESANQAVLDIAGVDGASPVRIIARDGLGCVVSAYRGSEFAALPREQTVRALLAHQQVVEHVMRDHAVLPVKFGTVLAGAREVAVLLAQAHSRLATALADIEDKVEIEVAATWDTARVLHDISQDGEVVRTREAITHDGEPSRDERIHLGEVVKARMDRRRDRYRERMLDTLKPLAVDVASNALVSDELVMNVAFLIERARQGEFDARVHQLDELFQDEISFRVIGPLPPYSFSTVEVARLAREQVEDARGILGLGDVLSEVEIRRAYRRRAAEEQRAASSGNFARLSHASEVLLSYCRARDEAQRGQWSALRTLPRWGAGQSEGPLFVLSIEGSKSEEIEPSRFGGTTGEGWD